MMVESSGSTWERGDFNAWESMEIDLEKTREREGKNLGIFESMIVLDYFTLNLGYKAVMCFLEVFKIFKKI